MPVIIVLAGLLLRGVYLAEISRDPGFAHPIYDPEYNAYWARALSTGDWSVPAGVNDPEIRTTPHGRPPGYPWFLAAVYAVFGVTDYAPRIIQMLIGLANALLLFAIGKRLFGRCTGFMAGLFMALYWVFPYFEGILTYPAVAVFVWLLMFYFLLRWYEEKGWKRAFMSGALLGAFALFRPNGLLIAPALLVWMGWMYRKSGRTWKHTVAVMAVFSAGCIAVLAPAFIRNYLVARDVVFISSYGGINLYVGNHPEASLVEPRIPELMELAGIEHWSCFDYPAIVRGLAARQGLDSIKYSEANRYFYRQAFSFIASNPRLFLRNLGMKTLLLFGPHEITNDTVMEYDKQFSQVLGPMPGFPWVFALFLFGVLLFIVNPSGSLQNNASRVRPFGWLLLLSVFFYSLSVVIYFIAGRYRVPIIPVMLLFSAYGVVQLAHLLKARRWVAGGVAGLVLVVLIPLTHWNITGYVPSEATWHLRRAMAYTAQGEEEKAREEYLVAETLGAESSIVYANLGRLHFEQGETRKGLDTYNKGLEKNPNNAVIRNNLGYELYKLGYLDAAIQHLERAVAVNPRFVLARVNLGNALADRGDVDAALTQYKEALRLNPNDPAASYNAARMLFAKGDYTGAADLYRQTLELAPEYALALNNLGYCYAAQGVYEEAIPYYERAIAADPALVLAHNNLANALLAVGKVKQAEQVLSDALRQDPENLYTLYNLGHVGASEQAWDKALEFTRKALSINPDYVPALVQLAQVYAERGERAQAIETLKRAAVLAPEDADIQERIQEISSSSATDTAP